MQSVSNDDLAARLTKNYTDPNFVPKVHAETLMVEHFYFNQLHFFGNDRYIGCSKPSCYCCDLYLRNHPGNFEARPSHGNVWVKWCLPFEADEEDDAMANEIDGNLGMSFLFIVLYQNSLSL